MFNVFIILIDIAISNNIIAIAFKYCLFSFEFSFPGNLFTHSSLQFSLLLDDVSRLSGLL